ncbi:hypothetical protein J1N35_040389 [Gossypium stocksii]|uniref:Endonuclease/exonuclease/phosphatase domain-containing protein n=1 Tax=Gossypium stocksii TaxID=47602 RepID=A0A9D3UDH8_9ROSI|nr:hypothetical protein J1N35_040389 [Gossypium stocksii]
MVVPAATTVTLGRNLNQILDLGCWESINPGEDRRILGILVVISNDNSILTNLKFKTVSSEVGNAGDHFDSKLQADILDNIKAHFNPVFEGPVEVEVQLTDNILDHGKHSPVTFKNFSNSLNQSKGHTFESMSAVDSMKEVAKLISSNLSNEAEIEVLAEPVPSGLSDPCAKFPRIFHEYNMEHKPDIVSLLETRFSGSKADKIITKLGFQFSNRLEAIGYAESIWIGWNKSIRVEIIRNHPQFIFTQVWLNSSTNPILIGFVYGSSNRQKRKDLWYDLRVTIPDGQTLWMVIGDFNAILSSNEKTGGLSIGKRCPQFGNFVDLANLHNLGFKGPPFTWHKGNLFERLDRTLGNKAWVNFFPNSLITHLPRIKSDHRPLLFSLNPCFTLPKGRPFRFLAGWVEHPDFDNFNSFGDWLYDPEAIELKASNFFQKLYGDDPGPMRSLPPNRFLQLASTDIDFLGRVVTDDEIKRAMFDMTLLKAPGSDGFHAIFFKKQWGTIGPTVCNWVKMVFNGRDIDSGLNNTLIVLIPKI